MGIMDRLFGNGDKGTPGDAIPASVAAPLVNSSAASPAPPPAGSQSVATAPAAPAPPSSPLDPFKDLWSNPVDAAGKPVVHVDPLTTPVFNLDPVKVREASSKLSFTSDLTPEELSAVVVNGQLNVDGLLNIINKTQQSAFAAATLSHAGMTQQALDRNNQNLKTALPSSINGANLRNMGSTVDNPVLEHPAVQPLIGALRTMQFQKDPNANPAEIASRVDQFVLGLSEAIMAANPNTPANIAKVQEAAKQTDFAAYMSGNMR